MIGVVGFTVCHIGFTTKEKVIDLGLLEVRTDKKHDMPLPDILAGIALAAGLVIVFASSRKA